MNVETIAFKITEPFLLTPVNETEVKDFGHELWSALVHNIAMTSPELYSYSSLALERRWKDGLSAIVISGNCIVSHISLIPLVANKRRIILEKRFCCSFSNLEDIWESATGWTCPRYRKRGIQRAIRQILYARVPKGSLIVAFCVGVGASPVLSGLGWHLVSWKDFKCIGLLLGYIQGEEFYHHCGHVIHVKDLLPFLGYGRFPNSLPPHKWESGIHLWLNNLSQAESIEQYISLYASNHTDLYERIIYETGGNSV